MRFSRESWAPTLPGVALCVALMASPCRASLTFDGSLTSGGHSLAAQVDFAVSGSNLVITLTNTSTQTYTTSQAVPTDLLTGLFFDLSGDPALTHSSAIPSAIVNPASPAPSALKVEMVGKSVVGTLGGWQFKESSSGLSGVTQHYGLGTAGFSIFNGNAVNQGPGNGFNYGIINSAYSHGQGNHPVDGTPLVQNNITFTLGGLPGGFALSDISNVRFQYGTSLTEASFSGHSVQAAPEPSTLVAALTGLALVWLARSRLSSGNPA